MQRRDSYPFDEVINFILVYFLPSQIYLTICNKSKIIKYSKIEFNIYFSRPKPKFLRNINSMNFINHFFNFLFHVLYIQKMKIFLHGEFILKISFEK